MKPRRTEGEHGRPQTQQTRVADSRTGAGTITGTSPATERGKDTATGSAAEP